MTIKKISMKSKKSNKVISLIVPCYNEEKNVSSAHKQIKTYIDKIEGIDYEIVFIDDGSSDNTILEIEKAQSIDPNVRLVEFSRNFGKEIATTAGINECSGDCCIIFDCDMQYPIEKLNEFIQKWKAGNDVVVGIRDKKKTNNIFEILGSELFYKICQYISQVDIKKGALDYRLLDRKVINEFKRFTERGRMTRALIDWLGFKKEYVRYNEKPRLYGEASFSFFKRFKLAFETFIVTSLVPLRLAGLLGLFISGSSMLFGFWVVLNKYILETTWGLSITGSASVGIFNLFLTGLTLVSIGLIALYIEFIHTETLNRPLYVIRNKS